MHHTDLLSVVQAWQDAVNQQQIERLLQLSDPNIEIVGPRGVASGHQLLQDWVGRAGLSLQTVRAFVRGHTVVVAQYGVWRSVDSGDVIGKAGVATHFTVEDQKIVRVARYDTLDDALAAAGIDTRDEVEAGGL